MSTIVAIITDAIEQINELPFRGLHSPDGRSRELSIAVTHLEDAQMRVNRAFAKHHGTFSVADVQTQTN